MFDKTFPVSGSFKASEMPRGALAKALKGKALAAVSGRSHFAEFHIRSMGE